MPFFEIQQPDGTVLEFQAENEERAFAIIRKSRERAYPETFVPELQDQPIEPTAPLSGPLRMPETLKSPTPLSVPPEAIPGVPQAQESETKLGVPQTPLRGPGAVTIPGADLPVEVNQYGDYNVVPSAPPGVGAPPPPEGLDRPPERQPPSYLIIPFPGARYRVRSRMTQEQWDRHILVRQLARRLADRHQGTGVGGPTDSAVNSMFANLMPQIRGAMELPGEGLARWLRPERADLEADIGLPEAYGLYRDAYRHMLQEYARQNPGMNIFTSILGGFGGLRPGAIGSLSTVAPRSTARDLAVASTYGAGFGALAGAAERPDATLRGAGEGAVGGAVVGPLAYGALRGAIPLLRGTTQGLGSLWNWYRGRPAPPRRPTIQDERATVWSELNVEPPPAALLEGQPRRLADFIASTPWGYRLRSTTGTGMARLQQSLTEALQFGGGPRNMTQAGEEAQALIRRALASGRTPEEIAQMSVEQLQALSGVRRPPSRPGEPPRADAPETPLPEGYRPVTVDELMVQRQLVKELDEELQAALARQSIADEPVRTFERQYPRVEQVPQAPMRRETAQLLAEQQQYIRGLTDGTIQPSGRLSVEFLLVSARHGLSRLQNRAAYEIKQDTLAAQKQAQAIADARIDRAYQTRVANVQEANRPKTEARRLEAETIARERVRHQRRALESEVAQINQTSLVKAQARAAETRAQRIAEQMEAQRAYGARPTGLPSSGESYATQLAAGERALAQIAPPVQGRLLGRRAKESDRTASGLPVGEQPTALHRVLNEIALEAKSSLQARGYKPENLFDAETGMIHADVRRYLAQEMGVKPNQPLDGTPGRTRTPAQQFIHLLNELAHQRHTNQYGSGLGGVERILEQLQALRAEKGVNVPLLDRIIAAIRQDVATFARQTMEGQHWLRERETIRAAKAQIEAELADPLRAVTGTANPAAAIQVLQQSMRPGGDLRMLRAFLQIAQEKGNRSSAVSMLLTDLAGTNLQGFLRNWRAITPEARALLFQGPEGPLGARLERFARAIEHVGEFPTTFRAQDAFRPKNILQGLATWLGYYRVVDPTTLALGVGAQLGADRALTSRWFRRFRNWYLSVPLEAGPGTPRWNRHMSLAAGLQSQASGLDPKIGRLVIDAVNALVGSAEAGTQDTAVAPQSVVFGGEQARSADMTARQEAELRLAGGESPSEVWRRTGWRIGSDGRWRFEIDDSQATWGPEGRMMVVERMPGRATLEQVISHEGLFNAYPQLRNMPVRFVNLPGAEWGGVYLNPQEGLVVNLGLRHTENGLFSILLHEIQHAVQELEGFSYSRRTEEYGTRTGEFESREVEERRGLSSAQRRELLPLEGSGRGVTIPRMRFLWDRLERGLVNSPPLLGRRPPPPPPEEEEPESRALSRELTRSRESRRGGEWQSRRLGEELIEPVGAQEVDQSAPLILPSQIGLRPNRHATVGKGSVQQTEPGNPIHGMLAYFGEQEHRANLQGGTLFGPGTGALTRRGFNLFNPTVEQAATVRRMREESQASITTIADALGVDYRVVRRWMEQMGLPTGQLRWTGGPTRNPTEEEITAIRSMKANGATMEEIGRSVGVAERVLVRWFRQLGLPVNQPRMTLLLQRRAEGADISTLAQEFGLSRPTVYRWLRMSGGRDRRESVLVQALDEVIAARRNGASLQNIAEDYGVTRQEVFRVLRLAGQPTGMIGDFARQSMIEGARRGARTVNERRAMQIDPEMTQRRQSLLSLESRLRQEGRSPEEIAAAISRQMDEEVTAAEIRGRTAWWHRRVAQAETDRRMEHLRSPGTSRTTQWRRRRQREEAE